MEDPNSIAWLCPATSEGDGLEGKYTWKAMRTNILEYIPPHRETSLPPCSRESTAPLEDDQAYAPNETSYSRLPLAFNPGPKGDQGFVFGWDPNCDIVLPNLQSISRRHCVLKFDDQRRPILRDTSSTGTIVTYDDQGGGMRRRFTWILGGHRVPQGKQRIIIQIHKYIRFQITISRHDEYPDQYVENVDLFEMGALGLRSAGSSIAPTPRPQDPIRLEQETLGTGAFAVVQRVWDVSTGIEYARKEPLNKRRFDRRTWEKEADIMNQISHDYVVKLIDKTFSPWPQLTLEYIPFGSLEDQNKISDAECLTILWQGLSALVELHGRREPIVHRDIKPANMLVHSRDPLHIKLSDFGLSRVSKDLTTCCGTALYLAPEVYKSEKYTPVVDIWSLGVVVFQFAYGLPTCDVYSGRRWCRRIIEEVNDWDSEDLVDFLSTAMLVMDPKARRSAQDCYQEALRLPVPSQGRCLTPTPTSYAEGYAPTVVYDPPEEQGFNQPVSSNDYLIRNEALVPESTWRSSQHKDSIRSDENQRYVRSEAPPPNILRKRSTRSSTPSSSGKRHSKNNKKPASSGRRSRAESEPVIDLFREGWLEDPNCVGSSVAAMGEADPSELSSWESWATGPSAEYTPRSIPQQVYEQDGYYDPYYGEGAVAQDDYALNTGAQRVDAFAQNSYVVDTAAHGGEGGAWVTSDDYMAAHLLYAIHEGERL